MTCDEWGKFANFNLCRHHGDIGEWRKAENFEICTLYSRPCGVWPEAANFKICRPRGELREASNFKICRPCMVSGVSLRIVKYVGLVVSDAKLRI